MFSYNALFAMVEKEIAQLPFPMLPSHLYDPARYILQSGGKRIRPCLTLMAANIFSDAVSEIIPVALAIEVFHNFTLMHDDILDNASTRRGNKTVHEKWDVNTAILSGDMMLVKAYELIAASGKNTLPALLKIFNTTAIELCEGQQADMDFEKMNTVSAEEYIIMIKLKTAALLGCCFYMGAVAAGAKNEDARLLYEMGIDLGISFQIQDDILDAYGDIKKFGKKPGGDIIQNKKTFLSVTLIQHADEKDRQKIFNLIQNTTEATDKIKEIVEMYDKYGIKQIAEKEMERYFNASLSLLAKVNAEAGRKNILSQFITAIYTREY